jgi:hypothetical protein
VPATAQTGATKVVPADPLTVTTAQYRQLPASSALGLSAFYIALLTLMCEFLAGTIVNSVVDSALGYAATEMGPRWRQRQPVPINRWQTLLIKWAIVAALTAVLTALVLLVAAGALGMDAPHPVLLWLFTWLCAASVGVGTLAVFALVGAFGQLIAMLIFVYAGLAASGGTVPVQALAGFLRTLSNAEPLRQILAGTRSIMYFNARADAGLTRGTVAAGLGLLVWLAAGTVIVKWYDRKGFYRLDPGVLAHANAAAQDYQSQRAPPTRRPPKRPATPHPRNSGHKRTTSHSGLLKTVPTSLGGQTRRVFRKDSHREPISGPLRRSRGPLRYRSHAHLRLAGRPARPHGHDDRRERASLPEDNRLRLQDRQLGVPSIRKPSIGSPG